MKWPPRNLILKKARTSRGVYRCVGYARAEHDVPRSMEKRNNIFVDHIDPIISPTLGFRGWDETIPRMFCEEEGLQLLCKDCHTLKTKEERDERTAAKRAASANDA